MYGAKNLNPKWVVQAYEKEFTLWDLIGVFFAVVKSFVLATLFAISWVFMTQPAEAIRFLIYMTTL